MIDAANGLGLIHDIDVRLTVELGRTQMRLREVLDLAEESVVMLDRLTDEPVDVMVNGKLIARGEVVAEGNRFGLRIIELVGSSRSDAPADRDGRCPAGEGRLMFWYVLKLLVLLPLIGLMIWGSLKLAQRMQGRFGAPQGGTKAVRIVETTMLSPTMRLAVIEFHGREILVSTSRNGLTRLAEAPARPDLENAA